MRKLCYLLCAAVFFALLGSRCVADVAAQEAIRSIALIQASEFGTGFSILSRGQTTYFVSAAHLLDYDAYRANQDLPQDDQGKKDASDWVTVYDPVDGASYPAQLVGEPDFATDLMVFKVTGMSHRSRPLCLSASLPDSPPFAIASFTVPTLLNPPLGAPFASQRFVDIGSSSTPQLPGSAEFQYASFQEQGFSGAPIFDRDTGAVIGVVRRVPLVPDPATGVPVPSHDTRYAVTVDALRVYLDKLSKVDAELADMRVIVMDDRTNPVPRLRPNRILRLVAFDQPHNGPTLSPVYAAYDSAIRRLIGQRFGQAQATAAVAPDTGVFPIGTDTSKIAHLCRLSDGTDAAGVVALRRELNATPHVRLLQARVALVGCNGDIIDARDLAAVPMNGNGPTNDQVHLFVTELNRALNQLAAGNDERLSNFAAEGVPLNDWELRGFYNVTHQGGQTLLTYSWGSGAAAQASQIYRYSTYPVRSIEGLNDRDLSTLTPAALDTALNNAGGVLRASFEAAAAENSAQLKAADRCFYLWQRKTTHDTDVFPAQLKRSNIL